MHNCCYTGQETKQTVNVCKSCDKRGESVSRQTIESLLCSQALLRLQLGDYLFDASPDCEVVYFSNECSSYFTKDDVRYRIGIKETEDPITICYCFGHTVESARSEILHSARSTVAEAITKEILAGKCACEVKNPSGRCCLGEVNKVVGKLFSESDSARAECATRND